MTPAENRPPRTQQGLLGIPRAEDLRTPNPLARLAAERWRLRRAGASAEALAQLGEKYRAALNSALQETESGD